MFTGDRISRNGWIAVFAGFLGVVLILRPKAGDFNVYTILPLVSAMLYAGAMILTRSKCRAQTPLVLSLALNVAFVIAGVAASSLIALLPGAMRHGFLFAPWAAMGGVEWLSMGLLATAILIDSTGAAVAYQNGPPAMIGAFDFAYIGFAVIWAVTPDYGTGDGILAFIVGTQSACCNRRLRIDPSRMNRPQRIRRWPETKCHPSRPCGWFDAKDK